LRRPKLSAVKESSAPGRRLTKTYKRRNSNIKAHDGSVLTDEKGILIGGMNISKGDRVHNHLRLMIMSHMNILTKK